jgi:hypothetical protein
MQFLRSILVVLALASPLVGCFSYTRHDADEGRPYYYDHGYSGYSGESRGTYYYGDRD